MITDFEIPWEKRKVIKIIKGKGSLNSLPNLNKGRRVGNKRIRLNDPTWILLLPFFKCYIIKESDEVNRSSYRSESEGKRKGECLKTMNIKKKWVSPRNYYSPYKWRRKTPDLWRMCIKLSLKGLKKQEKFLYNKNWNITINMYLFIYFSILFLGDST